MTSRRIKERLARESREGKVKVKVNVTKGRKDAKNGKASKKRGKATEGQREEYASGQTGPGETDSSPG